ncbi:triose-phosphate isomerase [Aeromicrobium sp.]|nr:triose-phosphate isomerase [Candidatus Saccharibacteria bacterium]
MKKPILVVGNWKMHLNTQEASTLVHRLSQSIKVHRSVEVVIAPSLLSLQPLSLEIDRRKFRLAAQDAYFKDEGAFTGEVSFTMLRDLVHYSIVGHSSRRISFNETLEVVREKVNAAVRNGIVPILCVGETKEEHDAGETKQVLHDQVTSAISGLTSEDIRDVVVAYEPVWAIGTGDPEKPESIKRNIDYIRMQVRELYGETAASEVRLLYGASVEPDFVHGILSIEGVDGLLVGGASLNHKQFAAIIDGAYQIAITRS